MSEILEPGARLSRYRVVSRLGAGGMGVVYAAEDTQLQRRVALKVLSPGLTDDARQLHRFRQEALAASSLSHPNIVVVHEIGSEQGIDFMVTELVEGETLRARMARQPLAIEQAIDIASQVASALAAAHKAGITHRDIKPENIVVRDDGYVKLLDFGLAKLSDGQGYEATVSTPPVTRTFATEPGTVLGTVNYMSPEQIRGLPLDARTDLFSLGTVLYEMVAGRLPHEGQSALETASAILTTVPERLSQVRPEAPPELDRILVRLLQKNREARYPSAADLLLDLKKLTRASGPFPAERQAPGWLWRGPALVLGALILAVLGGATYRLLIAPREGAPAAVRRTVPLTDNGQARVGAIGPDGAYLAYALGDEFQESLWVRQVSTSTASRLIPPMPVHYWAVALAPDNRSIYFVRAEADAPLRGVLYELPILGGTARRVLGGVSSRLSLSPDGKRFAFLRRLGPGPEAALMIAAIDGTAEREVARGAATGFLPEYGPAWSPDGQQIAWARAVPGTGGYQISAVAVDSGAETILSSSPLYHLRQLVWRPDGGLLITAQQRPTAFWPQILDVSKDGRTVRLITDQLFHYDAISVTGDMRTLAAVQVRTLSNIWIAPLDGAGPAARVPSDAGHVEGKNGLTWLADGGLAYSANISGNWVLMASAPDGSAQRQLTTGSDGDYDPSASGRYVVFASNREGTRSIWRLDRQSGTIRRLSKGTADWKPVISPDGRWVVFASLRDGKRSIWRVDIDGGREAPLFDEPSNSPAFSPDGTLVACQYVSGTPARPRIGIVDFARGRLVRSLEVPPTAEMLVSNPRWTPDGRAIAYVDTRDGVSNIVAQPLDGSAPRQLTRFDSLKIFKFAFSPDGTRLACARGDDFNDVVLMTGFDAAAGSN